MLGPSRAGLNQSLRWTSTFVLLFSESRGVCERASGHDGRVPFGWSLCSLRAQGSHGWSQFSGGRKTVDPTDMNLRLAFRDLGLGHLRPKLTGHACLLS